MRGIWSSSNTFGSDSFIAATQYRSLVKIKMEKRRRPQWKLELRVMQSTAKELASLAVKVSWRKRGRQLAPGTQVPYGVATKFRWQARGSEILFRYNWIWSSICIIRYNRRIRSPICISTKNAKYQGMSSTYAWNPANPWRNSQPGTTKIKRRKEAHESDIDMWQPTKTK